MTTPPKFDSIPEGYPKLSALLGKEQEYFILRKFRSLNARNLLYLQSELSELETRLDDIDKELAGANQTDDLKSWKSFAADDRRRDLVLEIRRTITEYNAAVLQYKQMTEAHAPEARHVHGLRNWLKIYDPIIDNSMNYMERRSARGELPGPGQGPTNDFAELISLNSKADSSLGNYLRHSWLKYFFISDMIYSKDRKEAFIFFNSSTIDSIVTVIAVICAVLLTIAAIVSLHAGGEKADSVRLGLIGLFTALIAAILALAGAKKSEVFIGTIGFVAVLVVFVSGENAKK